MDLVGHDFLTLLDFTPAEIGYLLDLAAELKAKKRAGIPHDTLRGKNVALIFEKTSTRTRCSFEVAAHDLGMGTTYLDPTGSQIGKKESIADTAQVLSGMFEGIEYRGYGQAIVEELAKYASVPVWNGLTNEYHPTQILADFLTLREHFGKLQGLKFAYMGDARYNMGNSLMIGCAKMGLHFVACAPKAYWPDPAHGILVNEGIDILEPAVQLEPLGLLAEGFGVFEVERCVSVVCLLKPLFRCLGVVLFLQARPVGVVLIRDLMIFCVGIDIFCTDNGAVVQKILQPAFRIAGQPGHGAANLVRRRAVDGLQLML